MEHVELKRYAKPAILVAIILALCVVFLRVGFVPGKSFDPKSNAYIIAQVESIKNWGDISKTESAIYGGDMDLKYQNQMSTIDSLSGVGEVFTTLQQYVFTPLFFIVLFGMLGIFFGHYKLVGPKHFNHDSFIRIFSKFNVAVHWGTAIPCVLLCITGLMMVFGSFLGGGLLIRIARDIHQISTVVFAIFCPLMLIMWIKDALPKVYDISWMKILGGYLSQDNTRRIPAGKFNAGQKMWFYVATFGGLIMLVTGIFMYFQTLDINSLRISAIVHNVMGVAFIALLITHIYMSVFAIENAITSIIDGNMSEEEVAIMHSFYYDELKNSGELEGLKVSGKH